VFVSLFCCCYYKSCNTFVFALCLFRSCILSLFVFVLRKRARAHLLVVGRDYPNLVGPDAQR